MPIVLNGITKANGGTVTFNGHSLKEVQFNGSTVWKAEQALSDASVTRSGDYTLSSTVWDMSEYTTLSGTFSITGGYNRWTGDGSASSAYGYVYVQLADGTRVVVPNTGYTLGSGTHKETTMTSTETLDLSTYSVAQRASVRLGIYTVATWSIATGMYVVGNGSATNVTAS